MEEAIISKHFQVTWQFRHQSSVWRLVFSFMRVCRPVKSFWTCKGKASVPDLKGTCIRNKTAYIYNFTAVSQSFPSFNKEKLRLHKFCPGARSGPLRKTSEKNRRIKRTSHCSFSRPNRKNIFAWGGLDFRWYDDDWRSSVLQAAEAAATKNVASRSVIRMSTNKRDFRTYIAEAIVQTSSVVHKQQAVWRSHWRHPFLAWWWWKQTKAFCALYLIAEVFDFVS